MPTKSTKPPQRRLQASDSTEEAQMPVSVPDISQVLGRLPPFPPGQGFNFLFPIKVQQGTDIDKMLEFVGIKGRSFTFTVSLTLDPLIVFVGIEFPPMELDLGGPVELFKVGAKMGISIDPESFEINLVPYPKVDVELKLRMDETSGSLLHFKGRTDVSPVRVQGRLTVISPSVMRIISKRVALVSTQERPLHLNLAFFLGSLLLNTQVNAVFSADQDITPGVQFVEGAGDALYGSCRQRPQCIVAAMQLKVTQAPTLPPVVEKLQAHMGGGFNLPNLVQAII
eukprot:CAMPEP_0168420664 /NCGR_PEP_ID=MMETSP0228-20121227/32889_1 /TAXON_ID=133427 /ORGANISM="Protoceratium reticulatum, Strain CCCM 535 (=CCMP 1889)" /LENGTH=282 /DNA_ID=CAMNT_0008434561 /DNA_START=95 /DNA_END=940 /DNA_ORIENTATION=-